MAKLDEILEKYTNERDRIKREFPLALMYPGSTSTRYALLNEIITDLTTLKKKPHGCYNCAARCDASNRHVTPIWRNVYCEDDLKCRSLTEENDKISPKWCPRDT